MRFKVTIVVNKVAILRYKVAIIFYIFISPWRKRASILMSCFKYKYMQKRAKF